jgi:hypothetical protein
MAEKFFTVILGDPKEPARTFNPIIQIFRYGHRSNTSHLYKTSGCNRRYQMGQ